MRPYSALARHYDAFTEDVGYKERTDYIIGLMSRFGHTPRTLLDLACGTGGFSAELALRGIEVIGADISEEMLAAAQSRMYTLGANVLLLRQDMRELDLYGTVDTAVCMLDGINHLCVPEDVLRTFERVSLFLEPGGLFIFDVNTPYKHNAVLSGGSYIYEEEGAFCVWSNSECVDGAVDMTVDVFEREEDGRYRRSTESFSERAYDSTLLSSLAERAGLRVLGIYGDMTYAPPEDTEERVYFVCGKAAEER